jgi:hypothetical protein
MATATAMGRRTFLAVDLVADANDAETALVDADSSDDAGRSVAVSSLAKRKCRRRGMSC